MINFKLQSYTAIKNKSFRYIFIHNILQILH